jgi:hypothetical protein
MYDIDFDYFSEPLHLDREYRSEACFAKLERGEDYEENCVETDASNKDGFVVLMWRNKDIDHDLMNGGGYGIHDWVRWINLGKKLGLTGIYYVDKRDSLSEFKNVKISWQHFEDLTGLSTNYNRADDYNYVVIKNEGTSNRYRLAKLTWARYLFEEHRPYIVYFASRLLGDKEGIFNPNVFSFFELYQISTLFGFVAGRGSIIDPYMIEGDPNPGHSFGSRTTILKASEEEYYENIERLRNGDLYTINSVFETDTKSPFDRDLTTGDFIKADFILHNIRRSQGFKVRRLNNRVRRKYTIDTINHFGRLYENMVNEVDTYIDKNV